MTEQRINSLALAITRGIGSPVSIAVHTVVFIGSFVLSFFHFIPFDRMLLILTTIVSLEAIYLAIFIQMSINLASQSIMEVEKDIDEIQGDIDEIQTDVEEISEDVEEIQEDVEEISEDVEEMSEDVEELQEDVDELNAEETQVQKDSREKIVLEKIQSDLHHLLSEIEKLKR